MISVIVVEYLNAFLRRGYVPLMNEIFRQCGTNPHAAAVDQADAIHFLNVSAFCVKYVCLTEVSMARSQMMGGYGLCSLQEARKKPLGNEGNSPFQYISASGCWSVYKFALDVFTDQFIHPNFLLQVQ